MKDMYIKSNNGYLYPQFNDNLLTNLQYLSGESWTNYNLHDPGITIGSVANYVLSELDYKLGFDLIDYLTTELANFTPDKYGMYLPEQVYPTAPVTLRDYRVLLLLSFPKLENVTITYREKGIYDIAFVESPFYTITELKNLGIDIKLFFHKNRNLCETVGNISSFSPPKLELFSDIEIEQGNDATTLLAQVYWTIISYLSGGIRWENSSIIVNGEFVWEESLEGPIGTKQLIIPHQENTMSELYGKLSKINGIKAFKACCLKERTDLNNVVLDFKTGYSLYIPKEATELKVCISIEGANVSVDIQRFNNELKALYLLNRSAVISNQGDESRKYIPKGKYRDVFKYYSIINDFPVLYKTYIEQSLAGERTKNKEFEAYLKLFDSIIVRGLNELKELKSLLSINTDKVTPLTIDKPCVTGIQSVRNENDILFIKRQYLDFLDHLYGVESNPAWMSEFYSDGEAVTAPMVRRMKFLSNVPYFTQARSKAYDIYGKSENNIPTIKMYLSLLLGLNQNEDSPVASPFSRYKFTLAERESANKSFPKKMNFSEIEKTDLLNSQVETVTRGVYPATEDEKLKEYKEIDENLYVFKSNLIWDELFRDGVHLKNYYIVPVSDSQYNLEFRDQAGSSKIALGSSGDKDELKRWANILCRLLHDLNNQSEVVYVLENHLFNPSEPFTISFVFSGWSVRSSSLRFREICQQLVRKLLPAHLYLRIYWLDQARMGSFEIEFTKWKKALLEDATQAVLNEIQKKIVNILDFDQQ